MFKLIIKDIRANYKAIFFRLVIPMLLGGVFFTYPYLGWISYFSLACLIIIISGSVYSIWEKNKSVEILTCSLPVTRNNVVNSRYLASLIITVAGLIIWGLNAFIADLIWVESATQLSDLFNLKILFMALFMISIHFSIFLPAVFQFRRLGMIMFIVFSMIISFALTELFFIPDDGVLNPGLEVEKTPKYVALLMVMIVFPWISMQLSKYLLKRKDLE